jgi:hypothetical protein
MGEGASSHTAIRRWAGAVSTALARGAWVALIEDERTQNLVVPFIGFFESDDPEYAAGR